MQMQTDDGIDISSPDNGNTEAIETDNTPITNIFDSNEKFLEKPLDDQCINCSKNQNDDKVMSEASSNSASSCVEQNIVHDDSLPSKSNPTVIMNKIKPVTVEDLRVLCQCFYLPYEHGKLGHEMVQRFKWLKTHCQKLSSCKNKTTEAYMVKVCNENNLYAYNSNSFPI